MSRALFGWSLPPGCSQRDIDSALGTEQPCTVCGEWPDDCICPECPVCHTHGDPKCYEVHGLVRVSAQIAGAARLTAAIEADAQADREQADALAAEYEFWRTHPDALDPTREGP